MTASDRQFSAGWGGTLARALSRPMCLSLLLAAMTLAVYWQTLHCGFIDYDDPSYFSENPHVRAGLNWSSIRWAFTTDAAANWHPLTWLSLMLDATLFGDGPAGPHLTNVLLHAANAFLLFWVLRRLTARTWPGLAVAALFALHPLHVESVAWVSERKDVLCAFFFLLTLLAYASFASRTIRSARYFYLLSLFGRDVAVCAAAAGFLAAASIDRFNGSPAVHRENSLHPDGGGFVRSHFPGPTKGRGSGRLDPAVAVAAD